MVVAIQRGLTGIYEGLKQRGFKVVFADECRHPVDIMIYNGFSSSHPLNAFSNSCLPVSPGRSSINSAVIEINAEGKSLSDIERLIARERQSSYF